MQTHRHTDTQTHRHADNRVISEAYFYFFSIRNVGSGEYTFLYGKGNEKGKKREKGMKIIN
jgi:hypothetical protein